MPRYVLDTQHYIDVLRDRPAAAQVLEFLRTFVAAVDFHAIVGAELLFGAHGRNEAAVIRRRFMDRFPTHRVIVPNASEILASGDVIRRMAEKVGPHPELVQRNFWNDVLIAVSCRRRGLQLLSIDSDHTRIAPFVGHSFSADFPTI